MEPDYASYTDAELADARKHIDVAQYPERAARLDAEIESRLAPPPAKEPECEDVAPGAPVRPRAPFVVGILALLIGLAPVTSHFESLLLPLTKTNDEALETMEEWEQDGLVNLSGFSRRVWDGFKTLADPPEWFVYYSVGNAAVGLALVGLHGLAGVVLFLRRRRGAILLAAAAGASLLVRLIALCVLTIGLGLPLLAMLFVLAVPFALDVTLLALARYLRRLPPETWNTAKAT